MSGYRRVNYYELCRLCTSSEGNKMNIFRDEGRRRQLQTKIETYLPIQVHEEDSLPKVVCHDCVKKLEVYIEFRDTVISAENMLESYFTSLRFSADFLKEGKVYVKSTEKERPPTPPEDPLKVIEKLPGISEGQVITGDPPQNQLSQSVVVGNVNASNIQIISGVQARVQQYKCAMQMQPGGVAAAVVEATAETHYSYQQQTSQQVSPQDQSRINDSQQQTSQIHQVQNQMPSQSQMNQQLQSQRQVPPPQQQQPQQQPIQQSQIVQQQNQATVVTQQGQAQITQQIQQLQRQQREYEKQQRQLQQIEKQQVQITSQQQDQQQQQQSSQQILQHQNNNVMMKSEVVTEQNQQITLKVEAELQNIGSPSETVQTYTTVQASPEVFLSLGLTPQSGQRDDAKEFKDYMKSSSDDGISRNSIGQISEFLRIRSCPEPSPLITLNPQGICQTSRRETCGDCGKSFDSLNELNGHQCPSSPMISDVSDMGSTKDDNVPSNGNCFSCDICAKPFKRKEHLFQHRKLHTGERPYVCTTCAKAFSRKEHLVRHSVSHTGQKMHECEMCGKSFSRKDNLHKHRKTHGVSGPYVCETCGKSFVVKHYYLMHLTTHAPSIIDGAGVQDPLPYKCDLCHKAFSVKHYLTTHKLRHRSKPDAGNSNGQRQQNNPTNDANATDTVVTNSGNIVGSGNGQSPVQSPVVEIQSVIERNDQNHSSFENNQYHGNVQQFQ